METKMKRVASLASLDDRQLFSEFACDGLGDETGRDGLSRFLAAASESSPSRAGVNGSKELAAVTDAGAAFENYVSFEEEELAILRALSEQFPNLDAVAGELATKATVLSRPPGAVHVISDIHGDARKLQHVLANASGTLRPAVEEVFQNCDHVNDNAQKRLLLLLFNPVAFFERYESRLQQGSCSVPGLYEVEPPPAASSLPETDEMLLEAVLLQLTAVLRHLSHSYSMEHVAKLLPEEYGKLLSEMLYSPALAPLEPVSSPRNITLITAIASSLRRSNRLLRFLRVASHLARNLAAAELLVGGDLWDRGPRGDRVCDILMQQPSVWIAWGNHDVAWYGAAVGSEALIAYVLRVSCRYNVLSQLEEGYGISMAPLEKLAKSVYGDDLADRFRPKTERGFRDTLTLAQMQKAAAVMQFKLEGQVIMRRPEFELDQDLVLHTFDLQKGTCQLDGAEYALLDTNFPTVEGRTVADGCAREAAYELSTEEAECMARLKKTFYRSAKLWEHMKFLVNRGSAFAVRHNHLLFHGAVPCSEARAVSEGSDEKTCEFLPFLVNGQPYAGKALFEVLQKETIATLRRPTEYRRDLMWYMWCGPRSPFMAKERVATLMRDLIADKSTHVEKKNAYFSLLHEEWFCDKVLQEFGCDPRNGMILNGHVPVSVKKDENPVKHSGKAVAIDGAFSEAYGDYGYTLVIEPQHHRTLLAQHHHTEDTFDHMPTTREVRRFENISGMYQERIRGEIRLLERLLTAYELNKLPQTHFHHE